MDEMSNHTRLDQLPCKSSFASPSLTFPCAALVDVESERNECGRAADRPHDDDDECVMYYDQFSVLSQKFTVQTPLMTN